MEGGSEGSQPKSQASVEHPDLLDMLSIIDNGQLLAAHKGPGYRTEGLTQGRTQGCTLTSRMQLLGSSHLQLS